MARDPWWRWRAERLAFNVIYPFFSLSYLTYFMLLWDWFLFLLCYTSSSSSYCAVYSGSNCSPVNSLAVLPRSGDDHAGGEIFNPRIVPDSLIFMSSSSLEIGYGGPCRHRQAHSSQQLLAAAFGRRHLSQWSQRSVNDIHYKSHILTTYFPLAIANM